MKIATRSTDAPAAPAQRRDDRTRDAVAHAILESGPQSAATLADRLGVSPAAVRRHLDALVSDGMLVEREPRPVAGRGRGRPARTFALTDAGRAAFPHAYDDLASTALRYLRETGGERAVVGFAEHRAQEMVAVLQQQLTAGDRDRDSLDARAGAVASGLSAHGYAASVHAAPAPQGGAGVQICQHHCPVAHVAAEFPQLCDAETRAFEQVLGTYVQRLATIAHGDGVCTTHVPDRSAPASTAASTASTAPSLTAPPHDPRPFAGNSSGETSSREDRR